MREVLPNYIQRGLERALQRKVVVKVIRNRGYDYADPQLSGIISPSIANNGALGVKLTAKIATKYETPKSAPESRNGEESLLLSPYANFGEIDQKLTEFSLRIATTFTELSSGGPSDLSLGPLKSADLRVPRGIIGLHCITSQDPVDLTLQRLARSLAIALPFHLTEVGRRRNLDVVFRGPDLKDLTVNCEVNSAAVWRQSSESRIENFSWVGNLTKAPEAENSARLIIRTMDRTGEAYFRPLPGINISDIVSPSLPEIAEQLIQNFVQQYSRGQFRLFLHIGGDKISSDAEARIADALTDAGYYVVGIDRMKDYDVRPGIDFFYENDCDGAANVATVISGIPEIPHFTLPLRKTVNSNNRPGTLGVWLADKAVSQDDPLIPCDHNKQ